MSRASQPIAGTRGGVLVLASGSRTRAAMLRSAGVPFVQDPADLDEAAIKERCRAEGLGASEAATGLARAKAETVAPRHRDRLVLGCDQLLECDGLWFDKPRDRAAAALQLETLSGRTHRLATAAVLHRNAREIWAHVETPELRMRVLSPDHIQHYLDAAGDLVLGSVGVYRLEGLGAQLFEEVRGDFFAVLGLPLLPLLAALRHEGVLP